MRGAWVVTGVAGFALSACATTAPWPDRDWVDGGCATPGPCRVRGVLDISVTPSGSGGALTLDDGGCLPVALPAEVTRHPDRWNGRRVAVRGEALARSPEGAPVVSVRYRDRDLPIWLCPPGDLVLYADRLSLKGTR